MPLYVYYNTETDEWIEVIHSWTASEQFLKENPHMTRPPVAPTITTGVGDRAAPTGGFKEMIEQIAHKNPNTPLGERYGSKGIKESKVREVVKKHRGDK